MRRGDGTPRGVAAVRRTAPWLVALLLVSGCVSGEVEAAAEQLTVPGDGGAAAPADPASATPSTGPDDLTPPGIGPSDLPTLVPGEIATLAPLPDEQSGVGLEDVAMPPPAPLTDRLEGPDLLVYSAEPLAPDEVARISRVRGVRGVEQFSLADVAAQDRILKVAAVDPASYRRFNPDNAARELEVWSRVAGGELSIQQTLGERLQDSTGTIRLGNDQTAPALHIGAYAPQVPQIDAVVNQRWGEVLEMPEGNAMLISTRRRSPQSVRPAVVRIAGRDASVQILGPDLDITAQQTAFLTGGSVAAAVGTFSYDVIGGGRIAPDPAWERANIRTEDVPILGSVRCHKVMLPQLRAALTEIASSGLADEINPEEYAGCYYPRFIAGTTQLSLHSFGIAVDLNVPGNQRGTVGEMDRTVVAIFKRWGFAWGGDWNYTDPMHFEMDALVEAR